MRLKTEKNHTGSGLVGSGAGQDAQRRRLVEFALTAPPGRITLTRGTAIAHEFPSHVHDSYTIGIVHAGSRLIRARGKDTIVGQGSAFVIPQGEPHSCATLDATGHTYTIISLEHDLLATLALGGTAATGRTIHFKDLLFHDAKLFDNITRLWSDLAEARSADYPLARLRVILEGLVERRACAVPGPERSAPASSAVLAARGYMESTPHANLSQKEIARFAGLSEFHLSRTFRRIVGISPHSYHLRIRIRKGQELLGQGASIVTAALETGFVDQSHFTRCFKRVVGVTPGRYKMHGWS